MAHGLMEAFYRLVNLKGPKKKSIFFDQKYSIDVAVRRIICKLLYTRLMELTRKQGNIKCRYFSVPGLGW